MNLDPKDVEMKQVPKEEAKAVTALVNPIYAGKIHLLFRLQEMLDES